jgi:hypothetical protein
MSKWEVIELCLLAIVLISSVAILVRVILLAVEVLK